MPRGGKRPGAGRKPQGITRKVSLTLTKEEWKMIEESGAPTVAAFIKNLINEVTEIKKERDKNKVTEFKNKDEASKSSLKKVTKTEGDQEKDEATDQISKAPRADGELTWNEVCDIYERETNRIKSADVLGTVWEEVMGLLFPMSLFGDENELTELRQSSGQFMCPGTGKTFDNCEEAVTCFIRFVIKKYQPKKKSAAKGA
jgi:hypothetical protein